MTKISAQIVADSINEFGNRITTMQVTFPRFILAELNTHRMLSKNSASSRAIPFEKMCKSVEDNPFIPIAWQKDHKGMQGTEYFEDDAPYNGYSGNGMTNTEGFRMTWLSARDNAVKIAKALSYDGLTKQLCNRLLEPFMYHTVLITATEWENFFALRCSKYSTEKGVEFRSKKDYCKHYKTSLDFIDEDKMFWFNNNKGQAEIHMMALAEAMWDAKNESTPKELKAGEWHIPFGDNIDIDKLSDIEANNPKGKIAYEDTEWNSLMNNYKVKIATAMCARVSYIVVGEESKEPNYENDIKLHDRLAESGHMSPFEHCAQAMSKYEYTTHLNGVVEITHLESDYEDLIDCDKISGWSGNFRGFLQYRKLLPNENITL